MPVDRLATAHNNKGRCLFDRARYDEAVAEFDLAIELEPQFAAAYYNRGRVHKAKGNVLQAEEDMATARELGFEGLGAAP